MQPSWQRRRCTCLSVNELNDAQLRRIQRRQRDRSHQKPIGRGSAIAVEIAKVRADAASIEEIEVIAELGLTEEIGVIGQDPSIVETAAIVDARSTADAPTAAVVRDVIAIARERAERTLPPRWWLG